MEFKISFFILILVFLLGINCVCAADNGSNAELIPNGNFDSCDVGIIHDGLNSGIGCDDGVMANEEAKTDVVLLNVRADENISSSNMGMANLDLQSNDAVVKDEEENSAELNIQGPKVVNGTELVIHGPKIGDFDVIFHSPKPFSFDVLQGEIDKASSGSTLHLFFDYNGNYGSRIQFNKDLTIDGHGHTLNCLGEGGCSAFYSNSGNIVLKNLCIINGHNDYTDKGGAIYITGSAKYTLINCSFINNWADDYGGAIYNEADNVLTLKDCLFKGNVADDDNGGAIFSKGGICALNTSFEGNNAFDDGGAVYCEAALNFTDCGFIGNAARGKGGAVYCSGTIEAKGCRFLRNQVDGSSSLYDFNGAAVYANADLYVDGCEFESNYADDWGGAIYARGKLYINYNDNSVLCRFISNKVDDHDGGAIYCEGDAIINYAEFNDNVACGKGGAVYSSGTVKAKGCRFLKNHVDGSSNLCDYNGGAIYANTDVYVDGSFFESNYADDCGDAVFAKGSVYINNIRDDYPCRFISNSVDDGDGGAICCAGSLYLNNGLFISNSAFKKGGAICCDGVFTSKGSLFEKNTAHGSHFGMAAYGGAVYSGRNAFVYNSSFEDNECILHLPSGGAVYAVKNIYVNIDQDVTKPFYSYFRGNVAANGGALYSGSGSVRCVNSFFELNHGEFSSVVYGSDVDFLNVVHMHNIGPEFSSDVNFKDTHLSLSYLREGKVFDDLSNVSLDKENVSFWLDKSGDLKTLFDFMGTGKANWKFVNVTLAPYTVFDAGFSDYHKFCLHLNHVSLCINGNMGSVVNGAENQFIYVGSTGSLSLVNVTLQNFRHCVVNKGTVYCIGSYFFDNDPQDHDTPKDVYEATSVSGGVIANYGTACFDHCVFRENHATMESYEKDFSKWWEFWGGILYAGPKSVNMFHDCDFKGSGTRFIKACEYSMTVIYHRDDLSDIFRDCYFDPTACLCSVSSEFNVSSVSSGSSVSSQSNGSEVVFNCSDVGQLKSVLYLLNSLVPNCPRVVVNLQPGVYEIESDWLCADGCIRPLDWRDEFYHPTVDVPHYGIPDRIERYALDVGVVPIVINGNGAEIKLAHTNIDDHFAFIGYGGSLTLNGLSLSNFNGVFHNYGTLVLNDCSLLDNKCFGGVLYGVGASNYFINCSFSGNGGALDVSNGFVRFESCNFINCDGKFLGKVSRSIVEACSDLKSSIDLCDGSFFYRIGFDGDNSSCMSCEAYEALISKNDYLPTLLEDIRDFEPSKLILNISCDCDVDLVKLAYDGDLLILGNGHKVNFNFGNAINIDKGSVTFVDLLFSNYNHIAFNVSSSCSFVGCNFTDNLAKYLVVNKGLCSFANCLFEGNSNSGCLVYNEGGSLVMCNSTFFNDSYGEYGLIYNYNGSFAGVNLAFNGAGDVSVANFETDDCGLFNCSGCSLVNDYEKYSELEKVLIRTALIWSAGILSFGCGYLIAGAAIPLIGLGAVASAAIDVVAVSAFGFGIGVGFGFIDDAVIGGSARDHSNRFDIVASYAAVGVICAWAGGICGFLWPLVNKGNDKSVISRDQEIEMEEKRNLLIDDDEASIKGTSNNGDDDEASIKGTINNGVDKNDQNIIKPGNENINIKSEQTEEISANSAKIEREVTFTNNLRFRLSKEDLNEIKDYLLDPNNKEVVKLAKGQSFNLEVSYISFKGIFGKMYFDDRP